MKELNDIFLKENLEYHPQKILQWLRSYNIPYTINSLNNRKYSMTIEKFSPNIQIDNVNECVFLTFLMWSGKNLEIRNNFLQLIQENETNNK